MTFTHGHFRNAKPSPTYNSWKSMRERCHRPNGRGYHKYGACGITVCDRWRNSFEAFLEDMGSRPKGHTIDRYPNKTGNYEPGNCGWATTKQQGNNKTDNRILTIGADEITLAEASELYRISYGALKSRISRGSTIEDAVTKPLRSAERASLSEADIAEIRREYLSCMGAKHVKPGTRQWLAKKFGVGVNLIHDLCRVKVMPCE